MRLVILALAAAPLMAADPFHEICGSCHTTVAEEFREHPHLAAGLDCDTCHGPSVQHREASGAAEPDRIAAPYDLPALCGGCHADVASQFAASAHGQNAATRENIRGVHCGSCHAEHRVLPAAAAVRRCQRCHEELPAACSEPPAQAARVRCAGCHAPHVFTVP